MNPIKAAIAAAAASSSTDRLAPAEPRDQQSDGIGADAEEGGVPERHDAGIAEDQIEREREHAP